MDSITKHIPISSINVIARIRKDAGAIEELATDIQERGMINPVTVMDLGNGSYQLIAGLRRIEACKRLGYLTIWTSILSPMAADEALKMEYAENVQRKEFTVTELLEYADKLKVVEQIKARERMKIHARDGYINTEQGMVARPYPEKGTTRDYIANRVGFSSGRQYARAEKIARERPELLEKIDAGETTIYAAYKEVVGNKEASNNPKPITNTPSPNVISLSADQVARAGHDRLMKNPLYAKLQEELKEARYGANSARSELDRKAAFFANQVKHFTSNIDALKLQVRTLQEENSDLRAQLAKALGQEDAVRVFVAGGTRDL